MRSGDREFALLAACCRWPAGPARSRAIAQAAQAPIDWPRFERLVERHRVAGLAAHGLLPLRIAPSAVQARLSAEAVRVARADLAMRAETVRLQGRFDDAGIQAFVVKGVALSQLAYGQAGVKESRDIDLVVPLPDLRRAEAILTDAAYRLAPEEAPLTDQEWELAQRFAKHRALLHPAGHLVELHFRLSHNAAVLAVLGETTSLQEVAIGEGRVRTLASDALYAHLCVHGGSHAWRRLKWLADLAAFLISTQADIPLLHEDAARRGACRASAVALGLCHDILGLEVPPGILQEGRASLATRTLFKMARAALHQESDAQWNGELKVVRERVARLLMIEDFAHLREEARFTFTSEVDVRVLRLSPQWAFLYPLVRVPSLMARIIRRRLAR